MKKQSFANWAIEQLAICPMTDEQLCGNYIRTFYAHTIEFRPSYVTFAVWGKKYESCRKMLSEMRKHGRVLEISREVRKNGSEQILFKLP